MAEHRRRKLTAWGAVALVAGALTACSRTYQVMDGDGRPVSDALLLFYDAPYLFDDRGVGAALTDATGQAAASQEVDHLAVLKPGHHPVLGKWPPECREGRSRITLRKIGALPTAKIRKARAHGRSDSAGEWIQLDHDLGNDLTLRARAPFSLLSLGYDTSDCILHIRASGRRLALVDRVFWSADKGGDPVDELTLDRKATDFAILAEDGTVKERVLLTDLSMGTGTAGYQPFASFVVADVRGIPGAVEPPVTLATDDVRHPLFALPDERAVTFFSVKTDGLGGYVGPLEAYRAVALFVEYVTSYRDHLPRQEWNRLVELHRLMTDETLLKPVAE